MSAVEDFAEDVAGGASDVVESVGNAVEDVGNFVVEDVLQPVVNTVEKTIEAAAEDPVGTMVKIAAISTMNPAIIAAAYAAVAVANGADLEEAALAAGKGYVASLVGAEVTSGLAPELATAGELTKSQALTAANVLGQTAGAAVTGGDPLSALVTGTIGAGVGSLTSEISGFEDLSKTQQAAINRAVALESQGKDGSQSLLNAVIGYGANAIKDSTGQPVLKAEEDVNDLITQLAGAQPEETLTQQVNAVLDQNKDEEAINLAGTTDEDLPSFLNNEQQSYYDLIGIDPKTLSDMPASQEDPLAFLNTTSGTGFGDDGVGEYTTDSLGNVFKQMDDGTASLYRPAETPLSTEDEQLYTSWADRNNAIKNTPPLDTSVGDMVTKFLNQSVMNKTSPVSLGGLGGLGAATAIGSSLFDESGNATGDKSNMINPYTGQVVNWNPMTGSMDDQGVAYGLAQLNPQFSTVNAAQGGIMSLAGGGPTQSSLGGYAAGGNPRLLKGPGDGMSDNIPATISGKQPARLADGEFVVPADVVSHLGNGSTEAGANVLYQMMERVRKARTGNSKQGRQINPDKFIPRKGK